MSYKTIYKIYGKPTLQNDGKRRFKKLGLKYVSNDLGMVEILDDITEGQREQLNKNLYKSGLELLDNKKEHSN